MNNQRRQGCRETNQIGSGINRYEGIGKDRGRSLTINTNTINPLRRIKGAYIASACGIALGVGAVIATTPWQQDLPGSSGSTPASALFQVSEQPAPPEFTYFLVGSQIEAARLEALFSAESHTLAQMGQPLPRFQVMVVDTTEREYLVAEANRELTQAGSAVKFVDWRR